VQPWFSRGSIINYLEEIMHGTATVTLGMVLVLFPFGAYGQQASPGASIQINGRTLFLIRSGVGKLTAAERAQHVNTRLEEILRSTYEAPKAEIDEAADGVWFIRAGHEPIIAVTEGDAQAEGTSQEALAYRWAPAIEHGLAQAISERTSATLGRRLVVTTLVILLAGFLVVVLGRARRWMLRFLEYRRERFRGIKVHGMEVVSAEGIYRAEAQAVMIVHAASLLLVGSGALLLVFSEFPSTRHYAHEVALWIWRPLVGMANGVVNYLPKLFALIVIVVVTRLLLKLLNTVFEQAHRGVINLEPWIHQDVAKPTGQIVKFVIIVVTLFFIAPLIPGTGSTAAQGISVVLGLMVSFGSTSTVGNIIAGVVLTYMRPFQMGERVKLGDTTGDVITRTFLYTKVLTIKNEEVIVPNLTVLGGAMVNYSARARSSGLVLHTSVTIGYDAPWRKVHELLLRAADRTRHLLKDPKPFVLQTALNDFFVSYELNVFTDQPREMVPIYSELHQNIQDSFNEGGVEIMSPHYYQLRDGNSTTIPADYRSKDYAAQRFLVDTSCSQ
jgi:small-conductance mechanosensitive channel